MASLIKRRGLWYARVRWPVDDLRKETQIPLKTLKSILNRLNIMLKIK